MNTEVYKKDTKKSLWTFILGGIVSIVFGVLVLGWPGMTLPILTVMLGVFGVAAGITSAIEAFSERKERGSWWLKLLTGGLNVVIGCMFLFNPGMSWVLFAGLLMLIFFTQALADFTIASYAETLGRYIVGVICSIIGVIFGFIIALSPSGLSQGFVIALGIYSIIRGVFSEICATKTHLFIKKMEQIKNW